MINSVLGAFFPAIYFSFINKWPYLTIPLGEDTGTVVAAVAVPVVVVVVLPPAPLVT